MTSVRSTKPSTIGWLKGLRLPSDWSESKVKYVAPGMQAGEAITAESIESAGSYPVYGGNGLRGYTEARTHHGTRILIGRQGALCGNVHLVSGEFWASEHAIVARAADTVDPRWLAYLLRVMNLGQYSQTAAQPGIGTAQINALPVPVPLISEQSAIADYLDRETARIDTLIGEQQRLIEMLRERRHALRVHVTLHGTTQVAEVESPLPWASQLPASWRVIPLTSVAQLESGHTPSRSREDWWTDCYIPWVSLHDVGTMRGAMYLQDTMQRISDAGIANSSARLLPARTVVLSRDATVGRTAIMGVPMATSQHFGAWVCGPLLDPEYLWLLFADAMQPFFDSFQNGSTIRTIGMGDLKAFRIPLPALDEQRRIVEYLDQETPKIDTLIAETELFIELARERRAALITAAVTGQIDVREMA